MCVCERETDRDRERSETEVTHPNRNLKSQVIRDSEQDSVFPVCYLTEIE